MPESFTKGQPIAQLQGQKLDVPRAAVSRSSKYGKSGQEICDALPAHRLDRRRHLHRPLDEDRGDQPRPGPHVHEHRHDDLRPAEHGLVARPTAWAARRDDLPGLRRAHLAGPGGQPQPIASRQWHSGFLPSRFQGVHFRSKGDPVHVPAQPPAGVDARAAARRRRRGQQLEPHARRRRSTIRDRHADRQYEMAFRMQTSVPELMDISRRAADDARAVRHARAATARSPPTACWPGGWPSAACGSSSSTTATGTTTTASSDVHRRSCAEEVDQADGGADHGPEAARHARRHAGRLGRRVRPHADGADQQGQPAATTT